MKSGIADLPLHHGKAPRWLYQRMLSLGKGIVEIILEEYGPKELLNRLSNPFWFQAFACVLGWDWHSSGSTTVVTAVVRDSLAKENYGVFAAGGKGKTSLETPKIIEEMAEKGLISSLNEERLKRVSKLVAKVDNSVLQDGFDLYHHTIFFDERGNWVVVQQGMNEKLRYARRYHWNSEKVNSFVEEPHEAIVSDVKVERVLNLVAKESKETRKAMVDLINENPRRLRRLLMEANAKQKTLFHFLGEQKVMYLAMPWKVNWKALEKVYDLKPKDFEEFVSVEGIGKATIKGLAYVANVIYGTEISWKDPVKYSFAYGGKDGVPRPVDRKAMDESIRFLDEILEKVRTDKEQKEKAFNKLKQLSKLVEVETK